MNDTTGLESQAETQTAPLEVGGVTIETREPYPGMFQRTVCLTLELHGIGTSRALPSELVEVDADKSLIRVTKTLLDCPEMKALVKLDYQIRRAVYNEYAIKAGFKAGFCFIPIRAIPAAEARLKRYAAERKVLVEALCATYPELKEKDQRRLRSAFNARDYPPVEKLRASYQFFWQYVSFGTPTQLKEVSAEFYQAEQEKAARRLAEAETEIQRVQRAEAVQTVEHLVDLLTGKTPTGRKKGIRQDSLDKVKGFLDEFEQRNVTGDDDLAAVVQKARAVIDGVDAQALRSSETLRDFVRQQYSGIRAELATMVTERPTRAIDLTGEEV